MKPNLFALIWMSLVLLCFSIGPLWAEQFGLFTYEVSEVTHDTTPKTEGYELRLVSVSSLSALDDQGESLVIVALVGDSLHIRIFNAEGDKVADRSEIEPENWQELAIVKEVLIKNPLADESGATPSEREEIIQTAASIIGEVNVTETVAISAYPDDAVGAVAIPSEIEGKAVTSIGRYAFSGCRAVTSVTIPENVIRIGSSAFSECTGLRSVTIPDSVTSIDSFAFQNCRSLTSVTIPSSVTYIFGGAFVGCGSLISILIPESVTHIAPGAFGNCSSIESILVDPENMEYTSVEGVLFDGHQTSLIQYPGQKAGPYSIPETVTSIGNLAFSGCADLTSITIPRNVTQIASWTPFRGCSSLAEIRVASENLTYSSIDGVLFDNTRTLLLRYPEAREGASYSIPDGVTGIAPLRGWGGRYSGEGAFMNCHHLTSITIPESVTEIYGLAFTGCSALESIVVIPGNKNYSSVDGVLFDANQDELIHYPIAKAGSYNIPQGIKSIRGAHSTEGSGPAGVGAFENCTGLSSVTIPTSVTYIGGRAFSDCTSLTSVTFLGDAPSFFWEEEHRNLEFANTAHYFTIHYLSGRAGFLSPTWKGNPAVMIEEAIYPAAVWLLQHDLPHDTDLHDDASLLMAYALDLDPKVHRAPSLPAPIIDPATGTLGLTFHAASPGITYTVETSSDLQHWTTDGVTLSELAPDNTMTASVSRGAPNQFVRLAVARE